jgi:hypothetical protein
MLTRPEQGGRSEIQAATDQRRQSERENGANRKAKVDKPVFVPGWRSLGMGGFAQTCFVAVRNYNRCPVRAVLHGDYSDKSI